MLSLQLVSSIFRFLPELPVEVLALKEREFILAARTSGKGEVRIAMDHILPNIASVLIVQGTIQFALGILAGSRSELPGTRNTTIRCQAGVKCSVKRKQ